MKDLDLVKDFSKVAEQLKAIRKDGQSLVLVVVEDGDNGSSMIASAANVEGLTYASATVHHAVVSGWKQIIEKSDNDPRSVLIVGLAIDGLHAEYQESVDEILGDYLDTEDND